MSEGRSQGTSSAASERLRVGGGNSKLTFFFFFFDFQLYENAHKPSRHNFYLKRERKIYFFLQNLYHALQKTQKILIIVIF